MAYQSEGDKSGGTVIQVMNLSSLETNTVEAASGEKLVHLDLSMVTLFMENEIRGRRKESFRRIDHSNV